MQKRAANRGGALIFALMIAGILALFTTALIGTNRQLFDLTRRSESTTGALTLGQGAINRLVERLAADSSYHEPLVYGDARTGYTITFDSSASLRSVNNLENASASPVTNSQGKPVPGHTADIVIDARCGGLSRHLRYVLRRGVSYRGGMGATGRLLFGGDVVLNSIASIANPVPVPCDFHANDDTSTGTGVDWAGTNSNSFDIQGPCKVTSSSTVSANIQGLNPGKVDENMPSKAIPRIDVAGIVSGAVSEPAPIALPGGSVLCKGRRHLSGPVTINGDVNLVNGSLYVDGDLTILGGVKGFGSVYCSGDITMRGGSAGVISNQPNGAAMLAGGDITFEGLDATGYLDYLAATNPSTVGTSWPQLKAGLSMLNDVTTGGPGYIRPSGFTGVLGVPDGWLNSTFSDYGQAIDIWWAGYRLGAGEGPEQKMRLVSPDGRFAPWRQNAWIRKVRDQVEALPGYSSDVKAQQVSRAFDQMGFFFRHNYYGAPSKGWDDALLGDPYWSIDHQIWGVSERAGPEAPADVVGSYAGYWAKNEPRMADYIQDYFEFNDPLDFSWLGKAYFQGVLYASGNVNLRFDATVIGSVICNGDLSLMDGAHFTYNREYDTLVDTTAGPVRVESFCEL